MFHDRIRLRLGSSRADCIGVINSYYSTIGPNTLDDPYRVSIVQKLQRIPFR